MEAWTLTVGEGGGVNHILGCSYGELSTPFKSCLLYERVCFSHPG